MNDDEFELTAKIEQATNKAVLVQIGDRENGTQSFEWIPVSHIIRYERGGLVITRWLAEEKGWL